MSYDDEDDDESMAGFCEDCGEQLRPNGDCPVCDPFVDQTFIGEKPKSLWDDPETIEDEEPREIDE